MPKTTHQEIDAAAADWAARIDRGPLSAEEEQRLSRWVENDARHRGAFMRMRAVAVHSERASALGPNFDPQRFVVSRPPLERPARPGLLRRPVLWVGGGAAACATVIIALRFVGAEVYDTRHGELRRVALADGSVMTLNTASRAEVSLTREARHIRLIEGEALFDVARDRTRPFIVAAGETSVRAIGTSFTVRHLGDKPVEVIVREGLVELHQPALAVPVRVAANMRAELPRKSQPLAVAMEPDAVNRELAWLEGRIAFEAETLVQAAQAFARYSDTRIVIEDPAIAEQQITGLFTANDPVGFARAAAATLGLEAEVRAGEVHLRR